MVVVPVALWPLFTALLKLRLFNNDHGTEDAVMSWTLAVIVGGLCSWLWPLTVMSLGVVYLAQKIVRTVERKHVP